MSKTNWMVVAALAAVMLADVISAQDTRGMILGRVVDPQESPVPGATVTVTNTLTNVATTRQTNEQGYYEANLLVAGTYQVAATAAGMKRVLRQGIELRLGAHVPIDIRMELGSVNDQVTVSAGTPLVETDTISTGRLIDNRDLNELPVAYNNPILLAGLAPGVQERGSYRTIAHRAASAIGSMFYTPGNVGGRGLLDTSNDLLLDGMPNLGGNRRMAYMPHTDSIQEFRIETSNLDASVGHSAGISLSMMTKSGSNDLHGALTWDHMQQRWNAMQFFLKQSYHRSIAAADAAGDTARANGLRDQNPKKPGRTNDYSVSLGGPVEIPKLIHGKNKLFFFINVNGTNQRMIELTSNINVTVPTLKNRQGDFSDLLAVDATRYQIHDPLTVRPDPNRPTNWIRSPFPGNITPKSRWTNPMANFYNPIWPTPNNSPTNPSQEPLQNYLAPAMPWNFDYYAVSNRFDYHHSGKHRFFGRWNWSDFLEDRADWAYETTPGLQSSDLRRATKAAVIDWVYSPTAAAYFDFAVSATQYREGTLNAKSKSSSATDVGLPAYLQTKAAGQNHLPIAAMAGYNAIGRNFSTLTSSTVYAAKANYNHVKGSHTVHAGWGARQFFRNGAGGGNTSGSFSFDNSYTRRNDDTLTPAGTIGHSYAAFLMGFPAAMNADTNDTYAIHSPAHSWYVQDNWRVTPKLNLILGLRAEWEGGMTDRYDRAIIGFNPALDLPITAAAQAAYAQNPVTELAASGFRVLGGPSYAGQGSVGRSVWNSALMWQPRVGAAYQLNPRTVIRGGYGIFFDSLNALYLAPNQTGFSRTTSTNISNDFGNTWLAGDPARGVSPLTDPFPVRADGSRFDLPVRNALGSMVFAGQNYSFANPRIQRARNQRWRVGLQRELNSKTMIEASYSSSYGDRVYVSHSANPLPAQYWSTGTVRNNAVDTSMNLNVSNPFRLANFAGLRTSAPAVYQQISTLGFFTASIIRKNQLLRPFPQMAGLTDNSDSVGKVWAPSFEFSLRRAVSRGVSLTVNYTAMKAETADIFLNEFDPAPTRRTSVYGQPHRLNVTSLLELPFGKGRTFLASGVPSKLFGGFQISLSYQYQTGMPIDFPNLYYYGDTADIAKGPQTLDRWFNTDNFERVAARAPGTFQSRVFPSRVDGVRAQAMNEWNANLMREFAFTEHVRMQFRLDALNLMNRTIFSLPETNPISGNFGKITATTEVPNRYFQVQVRLRF